MGSKQEGLKENLARFFFELELPSETFWLLSWVVTHLMAAAAEGPGEGNVFTKMTGLNDEWDQNKCLRERVRTLSRLLVDKPPAGEKEAAADMHIARTMENVKYNTAVLQPLLARMKNDQDKIPCINATQEQLKLLFEGVGQNATLKNLSDQAWSVRYLFGVLKQVRYREKAPKATWSGGLVCGCFLRILWFWAFCKRLALTLTTGRSWSRVRRPGAMPATPRRQGNTGLEGSERSNWFEGPACAGTAS